MVNNELSLSAAGWEGEEAERDFYKSLLDQGGERQVALHLHASAHVRPSSSSLVLSSLELSDTTINEPQIRALLGTHVRPSARVSTSLASGRIDLASPGSFLPRIRTTHPDANQIGIWEIVGLAG